MLKAMSHMCNTNIILNWVMFLSETFSAYICVCEFTDICAYLNAAGELLMCDCCYIMNLYVVKRDKVQIYLYTKCRYTYIQVCT